MKKVLLAAIGAAAVLAVVVVGGLLVVLLRGSEPPRDSVLVEQFRTRRAAFETLRRLLEDDAGLVEVGKAGVATTAFPVPKVPAEGDSSRPGYERYLALLKDAGGSAASRWGESRPEVCVLVWGSGWAGDTRHVAVCSRRDAPENRVRSLDEWRPARTAGREFVYRHVEGEWYLREDW